MISRRGVLRVVAPIILAGGGIAAGASTGLAFDAVGATAHLVSGCTSVTAGATCDFTYQFLEARGNPLVGCVVSFSSAGPGSLAPTSGTTSSTGMVTTKFTAPASGTGKAIVTADCTGVGAFGTTNILAGGVQGITTGTVGLPNTSPLPPGQNPVLFLGLGLAVMILVGGAVTLRRSRQTAS